MTSHRSIAAAQTVPVRGDVDANVEQHLRLARLAAKEGVQVLVFPELSLTGYELDLAEGLAFSENDPRLAPLVELASVNQMTLVVGAPVRVEERLHIGAFLLSPYRSIGIYTKHHLGAFPSSANPHGLVPPPESTVFQPGSRNTIVHFGECVGAVAICADTCRPSHAKDAADRGANTYLASAFIIPGDFEADSARLRSYAAEHAMIVALANYGGPSGGLPSAGRSSIWSESGELLAELGVSGSGVVIAVRNHTGWRAKTLAADELGDAR